MKLRSRFFALVLAALFLSAALACAQSEPPPDLDAWVQRAMKEFEVPGLALAIVKDGKVVVAKGYGLRKLGQPAPVDEHTLFGIASNTKAFTAAALAMLVDEGRIAWDDPVVKHLPGFQMYDPWVTRELRVRDLLCHRSGLGLGAGDLLYWPESESTRDEVVAIARWFRPASSVRTKYAYNNMMFVIAGQIIPAVSGKTWDEFVEERILAPLGMPETRTNGKQLKPGDNAAVPHSKGWDGRAPLEAMPRSTDYVWAAAAGIKSNVTDLGKWVTAQLNGGRIDQERRLFSEAAGREMWSAQTITPISEPAAPLKATKPNFSAYGLGWSLKDYRGRKVVSHTGGLSGMVSLVAMIPEENLGLIVLTNQEVSQAFSSIMYNVFDSYLHMPATDWIAAFRAARQESRAKTSAEDEKALKARIAGTRPTLEPAKYAGEYRDPWYGKALIAEEKGRLTLRMMRSPTLMTGELTHWNNDTFRVKFRDRDVPDAFVTFVLDANRAVQQMKMIPASGFADFSFDYQDLLFTPVKASKQ